MAVDASIVNGDITNSAYKTAEQRKTEENTAKNDLDKQAFLSMIGLPLQKGVVELSF